MRIVRKPVLVWLVDAIVEALADGPVLARHMMGLVPNAPNASTLARHMGLAIDLGLVRIDYRFNEPRDAGRSDPAVVELVEV
ncbi:hypothetical protein MLC59_01855 [Marinobacter bryozoorum]|uniref:hypothetical protein n=1 Tax=Marinobacter bryozoorum TaxID=256324 RepID=UPI002004195D|nr:hypothetical protein [Marinobacter bryozoorum]MCK7542914.1 hypothetical protein [Marinobacter bryozoorum]